MAITGLWRKINESLPYSLLTQGLAGILTGQDNYDINMMKDFLESQR